jgi:hypothetical protein
MALNILSIPVISTKPKRLFLGVKISLTNRQNYIGDNLLQALKYLKSWYKITN